VYTDRLLNENLKNEEENFGQIKLNLSQKQGNYKRLSSETKFTPKSKPNIIDIWKG
jgi:hypothetical protein